MIGGLFRKTGTTLALRGRATADEPWAARPIHVLAFEHDMISKLTLFAKPTRPQLFHQFGLPLTLTDAASAERR